MQTGVDVKKLTINYIWIIIGVSLVIRLFFICFNGLLVEEAYYWNYAQHLDFGYLDHPPMVALLIKLSTLLFGTNEISIHLTSFLCWLVTAFFIYKWTELIKPGAGQYAFLLLCILPFFFIQSMFITPDSAVMLCWAAALYYLYKALVLDESQAWYKAGIWVGLGLISKYTIVLLLLPTFFYLCIIPSARKWFMRKEIYISTISAVLFFTPVIYWNATHDWASFTFQSVRRFSGAHSIAVHKFILLVLLFLMPAGLLAGWQLFKKETLEEAGCQSIKTQRFLQLFTIIPLAFFGLYSFTHAVNFDWIGPGLLSLLPWLAMLLQHSIHRPTATNFRLYWLQTSLVLLIVYFSFTVVVTFGIFEPIQKNLLKKYFSWRDLTVELNTIATQLFSKEFFDGSLPIFIPLDAYNIGSELIFYQTLSLKDGTISTIYPVVGRHIFNDNSLMYNYWFKGNLSNKKVILVSTKLEDFNNPNITSRVVDKSPIKNIWSHSQRAREKIQPFYYKLVEVKPYV
jgi:4-amino-4-deoxy-L-arabinose transferase-like glycosyltransferase